MKWTVSTETEFEQLMEEIDSELRQRGVPVHARQLQGWFTIAQRFQLEGLRLTPSEWRAKANVYSGDDLSSHILNWFERRYGERLIIDYSIGHTILVIRDDAYRVRLPRIYGRARIVCDPAHHKQAFYKTITLSPNIGTINILDSIEGLQPALSKVLHNDELVSILLTVREFLEKFMKIETALDITTELGEQTLGDIKSSVDSILRVPSEYGPSRWHSLQAAEKCLKLFLQKREITYPRSGQKGHDLILLSKLAEQAGLLTISELALSDAICDSKVRYGEVASTLEQAVAAHRAAVSICSSVASQM